MEPAANEKKPSLNDRARALLSRWPKLQSIVEHRPLWRWSRRGVSRGAAVGVFIGIVLPFGQIPAAAGCAAALRANLPITVASTWITNPVTTIPFYYAVYKLGEWIIGPAPPVLTTGAWSYVETAWTFSLPLLVGAPLAALLLAPLSYFAVNAGWRVWVRRRRPQLYRSARLLVLKYRTELRRQ